jgi:hypothetical protein
VKINKVVAAYVEKLNIVLINQKLYQHITAIVRIVKKVREVEKPLFF